MANLTPVPQPAAQQIDTLQQMQALAARIARVIEAIQSGQFFQPNGVVVDLSFGTTPNTNAITNLKNLVANLSTQAGTL